MRLVRFAAASCTCVAAYLLPYLCLPGIWWRFALSTIVIVACGVLAMGADATSLFGLRMTERDIAQSLVLFAISAPMTLYLLSDVVVQPPLEMRHSAHLQWYVSQFFQVLNDELVIRASLLTTLLWVFPYPRTVIVLTAFMFAFGHQLVYGFDGVHIDSIALLSLFSFGVIANTLFVRFGHIGYGVALHYAWNAVRFTATYRRGGDILREGVTFNYIEGDFMVATLSTLAMIGVFVGYTTWAGGHFERRGA